ncbi:NAD(P)-binding protein [Cylindrobasidium torrendii FP15055 ss-10]|uniref:NAD(P)-binding protein n=1 Tax=Cylindrobasidium torrendii FP15055 ss-10 TaxID=1314674 RepID=A0A0D7BGM6_9AGAR|nr:NAD(P)-binding protein [Cylindrobasidium torrendii FP15055 ss-10]
MSNKLIFVTGASGFIGFEVTTQLIAAGYRVRCPARGAKVEGLKRALKGYNQAQWEVVDIPNIFSQPLQDSLKDVDAVVHIAFNLRQTDAEQGFKDAIDGSIHLLEETFKAGITKVVVTGSTVTWNAEGPYGPAGKSLTKEDAIKDSSLIYDAAKTASDKAIVAYVAAHPEIDLTIISPDFTYGPLAPGFEELTLTASGKPWYGALSASGFLYRFLKPDNKHFPHSYGFNDVRDSARAHVLALKAGPAPSGGAKRFPIVTPENGSYLDARAYIAEAHPELVHRLVPASAIPQWPSHTKPVDRARIEAILGFKQNEYTPWKKTVLDSVDSWLKLEAFWKAKGNTIEIPDTHPFA